MCVCVWEVGLEGRLIDIKKEEADIVAKGGWVFCKKEGMCSEMSGQLKRLVEAENGGLSMQ